MLIFDEPTAVLTPQEVDELLVSLKRLKEQGKTIILITHKLREVILVGAKSGKTKDRLMAEGFKVSCYVTYSLPDEEVEEAKHSNGFVYLQAKPAGEIRPGCETLKDCILYLREQGIGNRVYAGVGVSLPEDVAMVASSNADGAFIGSALLKQASDIRTLGEYIAKLKNARDCIGFASTLS